MAIVKCSECGQQISSSAPACPNCGKRRTSAFTKLIAGFFVVVVLSSAIAYNRATDNESAQRAAHQALTPEQKAAEEKAAATAKAEKIVADARFQRAIIGAATLRKMMRDPDSFKLESALIIDATGAVCYEYRAHNGFGGVNIGQALLAPNKDSIITSESAGFVAAWNRSCARQSGIEKAESVQIAMKLIN